MFAKSKLAIVTIVTWLLLVPSTSKLWREPYMFKHKFKQLVFFVGNLFAI